MRIVVFGASGATGRHVVDRVLERGHEVIAAVRTPGRIPARDRLEVRQADVLDLASVHAACVGAEVCVSCIGPSDNRAPGTVLSDGTRHILVGCIDRGVGRFVMQSGITLSDGTDLSAVNRCALSLVRPFFREAIADKAIAERAVQSSSLDWVIVRPVALSDGNGRGRYTAGPRVPVSPFSSLTFADCAECLVRAATEPAWSRQIINVGR